MIKLKGLFQPMRLQIGSYKWNGNNIVIASSASSAIICDDKTDLMKLKHSYHFRKDTQGKC